MFKTFLIGCLVLTSTQTFARTLTFEEKKSELTSLANLFSNQYGPLEYKASLIKLNLNNLLEQYSEKAKNTDNNQFYYLLNQFIAEFQDSHSSASLNTDLISKLGFTTDLVNGQVLIDEVDTTILSESTFPFKRGDEIVSMNKQPVMDLVSELSKYRGMGYSLSALRFGAMSVSYRSAAALPAPNGKVSVEIRKGTSLSTDTIDLEWKTEGETLPDSVTDSVVGTDYKMISIEDLNQTLQKSEKSFRCSPKTRIEKPKGATIIFDEPFVAYYHSTAKGNVGYLRIPHYNWKNAATSAEENKLRLTQYEFAIEQLEKNTVALVIDQDHNCGGAVDMVESMVGLFLDKPFTGLEFKFLATRAEYLELKSYIEKEKLTTTVEGEYYKKVLELVKTTWNEGKSRLTAKTTFQANRLIRPNEIHYTKPVLILIDEMSGSGGDAFPAMMQGFGRAKLFGTRTMGAGGHVISGIKLPLSGSSIRMTKSLFFHPNGKEIENNGASPDYPYTITREDFMYGYKDYRTKYTETILNMLP